jgi:hypothetical protein
MTSSQHPLTDEAEAVLSRRFARLRERTSKLAAFLTQSGRQIALARERKDAIYMWAELFTPGIEGVVVNNQKRPGLPYAADQDRSSAVNSQCSNLAKGNVAWYLRCDTVGALEEFAAWYDNI